jgi:hypothetical protein
MYMARRKKTAKKTTRRRSRVSGIGSVKGIGTMLTNAALATGGYIAATMLGKFVPGDNNLLKGGAKIAAGVATGKFIKGTTGQALAMGMAIAGVVDVAKQFAPGLISGIGEDPTLLISGIDSIGGENELGQIESIGGENELGSISTLGGLEDMDF